MVGRLRINRGAVLAAAIAFMVSAVPAAAGTPALTPPGTMVSSFTPEFAARRVVAGTQVVTAINTAATTITAALQLDPFPCDCVPSVLAPTHAWIQDIDGVPTLMMGDLDAGAATTVGVRWEPRRR